MVTGLFKCSSELLWYKAAFSLPRKTTSLQKNWHVISGEKEESFSVVSYSYFQPKASRIHIKVKGRKMKRALVCLEMTRRLENIASLFSFSVNCD